MSGPMGRWRRRALAAEHERAEALAEAETLRAKLAEANDELKKLKAAA